jgi:CheY-like chemotaxis protein
MKPTKVLIIGDEQIQHCFLSETVRSMGFDMVAAVNSTDEAIEQVLKLSPDVILMDIRLFGKIADIEVTKAQSQGKKRIPIIYITTYADDNTLSRVIATNPIAHLLLPFSQSELDAAIKIALSRMSLEREIYQSEKKFRSIFETSLDPIK